MRRMLLGISPALLASVMVGGFVVNSTPPATAEDRERRDRLHAGRPIAASSPVVVSQVDLWLQIKRAIHEEDEARRRAEAEYFAGIEAAARAATARAAAYQVGAPSLGRCNGDVACFLPCTRAYESDSSGGYRAVSPGGRYRGAYQFLQATWDAAVTGAGHGEWAGIPADQAPPEVQDAAAAHLYSVSGNRPWGGRC